MPDRNSPGWEQQLLEHAMDDVIFPPTPDLTAAVFARIDTGVRPRPSLPPVAWRTIGALAAVALLVFAATILVSRETRDAVADFLGLAVEGERIERLPTPAPGVTPTPFPTPPTLESFATPAARSAAEQHFGRPLARPDGAPEPNRYFLVDFGGMPGVVMQFGDYDFWQSPLGSGDVIKKSLRGSIISNPEVSGEPAYFLSGGERIVTYVDSSGHEIAGTTRTVLRNTLVWSAGGVYYRLEGDFSEAEAVTIAKSVR